MPKIENDETKRIARPFVIIAQKRSGGTVLAHCLSSHPDVYCDRGETFHELSVWGKHARGISKSLLAYILGHQEGYLYSGFRCVYLQALDKDLWNTFRKFDFKVIHLTRSNILRQGASIAVQRQIRAGKVEYYPVHTFRDIQERDDFPRVEIQPWVLLKHCREVVQQDAGMVKNLELARFDVLKMKYTDFVGKEGKVITRLPNDASSKLCDFLELPSAEMTTRLKRVSSFPLREMFVNWDEIETAVKVSEFADFLSEEEGWECFNDGWRRV